MIPESFYRIDAETGCWVWLRSKDGRGYGSIRQGSKVVRAHRWAYEQVRGPIPEGLPLDHLCRIKLCVNPDHLEPVTTATNTQRGAGARLTWEIVHSIRASRLGCAAAAREFGISEMQASRVLRGKTWRESNTKRSV